MTMTNASLVARAQNGEVRDDPAAKPVRRRFTIEYKHAIVEEYDAAAETGAKGAILRREGLYTSHIVEWRRAKEAGALAGLAPKHRKKRSSAERELLRANKRIERLEGQLANHKQALEIQGKASELLSRLLAESSENEAEQP
jgi:transposase